MTNPKPFAELLADVQAEVNTLRTQLQGNLPCDATALAPKLQAMIEALPDLPQEIGLAHQPAINALQNDLRDVSNGFAQMKTAIQKEMQTINDRMKAATAYAQSTVNEKR